MSSELADAGRVLVDGASPGGWRTGDGGSIRLAVRGTRSIVPAVHTTRDEDKDFYINVGFPS